MITHIVRALFLLAVLAVTLSSVFQAINEERLENDWSFMPHVLLPPLLALGVILLDMFWRNKRLEAFSGLFFGILAGLVIAYMLSLVSNMLFALFGFPESHPFAEGTKLLLGAMSIFMCVSFVLQTKDDFRFVIPYVEFARESKGPRPLLLDTSVIIDGRIADMAETGVFESELLVPRFILAELQGIADSDDKLRRNRGRRGLDILNRLQGHDRIDVRIVEPRVREVNEAPDVDSKLLAYARHLNGRVVTNDYNLNKVASLRGVEVININDLANALKPIFLPGEQMAVKPIKPGEESGQGVGYLEDGTMVVIEGGRDYIGRSIGITVTSVIQTSAGRMIFGKIDPDRTFSQRPG